MLNKHSREADAGQPGDYQIKIKGHLAISGRNGWSDLTITLEENGDTLLTGPVVDQATLHGLLKKCVI